MLICNNCGKLIREEYLGTHDDFLSYIGDKPYYETTRDTCFCGGDFVEAVKCDSCDEYFHESDITRGWRYDVNVCHLCIDYFKRKYEKLNIQISDKEEFVDFLAEHKEIIEK